MSQIIDMERFIDSPELAFTFARKSSHILNTRIYELEYPELDYGSLVTINTDYPEWAGGVDTLVGDAVGKAEWQSGYAKDIPLADTKLDMVSMQFDMYAVGYQWNLEEIGKAAFQNFPLTNRRAEAARRASEEFLWNNVVKGSAKKGWGGLTNSPYVTPVAAPATGTAAPNTAWVLNDMTGNKTPEQIVAELNDLILGPVNPDLGTMNGSLADTILLPPLALRYLVQTPYGVTSPGKSIIQYFMENNEYTRRTGRAPVIRELAELSRAATVGVAGGGRAVGYRNSPDVVELPMPMPFRFLNVHQDGPLNFVVPGISRVGGIDIKRTMSFRYLDGITPVPA